MSTRGTFLRVGAERWTRLESLIVRLGTECRRLQRENLALARTLADREQEIARLRSTQEEQVHNHMDSTRFLSTKEQIRERIDALLVRIDAIELPVSTLSVTRE